MDPALAGRHQRPTTRHLHGHHVGGGRRSVGTASVTSDGSSEAGGTVVLRTRGPRTPTSVRPFIMSKDETCSHDSLDDYYTCIVCLGFFREGEEMYELPCQHRYHKGCVRKYVREKRQCPKCMSVMPPTPPSPRSPAHAHISPRAMTLLPRTRWVPDSRVDTCGRCRAEFTFFRRRHHCRCCGRIFCSDCCPRVSPIPIFGDTFRACEECKDAEGL